MPYFAEVIDNVVHRVLACNETETPESLSNWLGGAWIQTSYNTVGGVHRLGGIPLRKNFAGAGYTFDQERDAFIAHKPYPSWILDEESCTWGSPIPCPVEGGPWVWDEAGQAWH